MLSYIYDYLTKVNADIAVYKKGHPDPTYEVRMAF